MMLCDLFAEQERSAGSFRDSISFLDQLQHMSPDGAITAQLIEALRARKRARVDMLLGEDR